MGVYQGNVKAVTYIDNNVKAVVNPEKGKKGREETRESSVCMCVLLILLLAIQKKIIVSLAGCTAEYNVSLANVCLIPSLPCDIKNPRQRQIGLTNAYGIMGLVAKSFSCSLWVGMLLEFLKR